MRLHHNTKLTKYRRLVYSILFERGSRESGKENFETYPHEIQNEPQDLRLKPNLLRGWRWRIQAVELGVAVEEGEVGIAACPDGIFESGFPCFAEGI
jgi:hypothetical protein